uniref:Uncharacterized protein n=1 Tax=Paramoeba aestuarina TaxID=180227 RepID=A0A7S4JUQ1_9EUKA|mmetsp:Transcript_12992/g.19988  ORF Transcript_12992/g.19988 Transcript_12992/m.19988 type:complete len:1444 (+) Transcript_12992:147-4478(+)
MIPTIAIPLSWFFVAYLLYVVKKKQPLGPFWWTLPIFLILNFLANSCKFYYSLRLVAFHGWSDEMSWFLAYYILVGTEMGVGLFLRQPSPATVRRFRLSREEAGSFYSQLTFTWMSPILELGSQRPLTPDDLWKLAEEDRSSVLNQKFTRHWNEEMAKPSIADRSLVRALRKAHALPFYHGGFFKLAHDLLMFLGPLWLNLLIQFVGDPEEPAWVGYAICFALGLTNLTQTAVLHQYFKRCFSVGMNLRSSTIVAVYDKSLRLSIGARQASTHGAIVNLMAVDAQRFQDLMPYLHMVWSAPMQIALALYFLYLVLGASIFAGFLLMVILIPINGVIAKKMRGFQTRQMGIKDTRLKLLNEILNGIKVIKLYAWEESFLNKVEDVRNKELTTLRNASLIKAVTSFLWTSTPILVSVVTFATYVGYGGVLTADKAFTALSLFNILRFPTNALPMVITNVAEASVSVDRLFTFLNLSELDPESVTIYQNQEPFIELANGVFSWSAGVEEQSLDTAKNEDRESEHEGGSSITLSDINLRCKTGRLTAIIGKVGCGKSSLISACLGEIPKVSGNVSMAGSVAYAPQQAWIQNATLRDNIVFGQPFIMKKYLGVIDACCLEQDIAMLPGGDLTEVGEKGITLSGGQKQRVSLARAVYQDADVYLLDDPLSAVDAHVGRHIFDNVIGPAGLLSEKVRVLVTHAEQYLPQCDSIFVMDKGMITMSGTYQQLVDQGHGFADTLAALKEEEEEQQESLKESDPAPSPSMEKRKRSTSSSLTFSNGAFVCADDDESGSDSGKEKEPKSPSLEGEEETESAGFGKQFPEIDGNKEKDADEQKKRKRGESALKGADEGTKLIASETRETGQVSWSVYWQYFKSLGVFNAFMIFFSFCLQQGAQIGAQLWLAQWTAVTADETAPDRSGYYLGIYSALSIVSSLGVLVRAVALLYGSLASSKNLHVGMLDNVCHAPMSFFDTTPLGRIVNRFSKDIYTVDEVLPNIIGMWLGSIFYTLSIIVILLVPLPYFVVVLVPVGFLFFYVQKFYLRSSREVQRLDSISRSPIYAHFGETLNGVSTVRSYSRESDFIVHNHEMIDENQKAYFINVSSNRWLAVRLETVGTAIVTFASLFSVIATEVWWNPDKADIHASLVGLAISSALSMTQVLNWAVRMNCQMETNIVSVERVKEYTEIEREAPPITDFRPPAGWPSKGEIALNDIKLRYREGLDLVLKGVSINIGKHEKIGIVGRTGAGKSTVTLGLFRIVELAGGSVIIDGVDISKLGLADLRKKLSIIPQDPVLFSGTLRENLDPFGQYNDQSIYEALTRSHLMDFVSNEPGGINMEISENGENLSVGQRQLVCMARALLRKSPILVMDEATAAVDYQTDSLIQETIRSEFKNCTVLTIAHRLNTIMDSDRILVLGAGRVLELDTPQNLMANNRSHLARMVADANKAQQM